MPSNIKTMSVINIIIDRVRMRRRHGHWTDSHEFKPRQVRPLRGHYAFTTPTRGTSSIQNNHFHDVDFFVTFARQGCLALLVYLRKTCYWYLGKGSNTSFQFCSSKGEGSYPPLPSPLQLRISNLFGQKLSVYGSGWLPPSNPSENMMSIYFSLVAKSAK